MTLIAILVCLGLQRYLQFNRYTMDIDFFESYFTMMSNRLSGIKSNNGLLAISLIIIPLLIVIGIVSALTYRLLGNLGYFIWSAALLWYCLDGRQLSQHPFTEQDDAVSLLTLSYQRVFGILFWFSLLGPIGVTLYYSSVTLRTLLNKESGNSMKSLADTNWQLLGILDWVPARLLGLAFGLVGHFNGVLKTWVPELKQGIQDANTQIIRWGEAALQTRFANTANQQNPSSPPFDPNEIITLLDRSLLVWLVVIALMTIAIWFG